VRGTRQGWGPRRRGGGQKVIWLWKGFGRETKATKTKQARHSPALLPPTMVHSPAQCALLSIPMLLHFHPPHR
jgi:hypothetical protein